MVEKQFCAYCGNLNSGEHFHECLDFLPGDKAELLRKPSPAEPHMSGPAGPVPPKTLRDEFAMAALTGLLSYVSPDDWVEGRIKQRAMDIYVGESFRIADEAMRVRVAGSAPAVPPEKRGEFVPGKLP